MTITITDVLASPGEERYVLAVDGYNLRSDLEPAFAAVATTTDEVVAVLDAARQRGLGVRVRSTGHGFNSGAPLGEELVLRTMFTAPVAVDVTSRTAVVPAGALWGDVVDAAAPFGLAALHGSAPSVGVIGYLLQGGASFYGRRFGLASNLIRCLTVVLADGRIVVASAETDPELFWALRGGGGGFGIVTSVTIDLIEVPSVATGAAFWPVAAAPFVLDAWDEWAPTAPREVSTALRVMSLPPQPGIPPELTDGPVVVIDGAALDRDDQTGTELIDVLLAPLRQAHEPLLDTWHRGSAVDVASTHMDPPTASPFFGDHVPLDALARRVDFGAPQKSFGPAEASRVEAVRRRSDPTGMFVGDVTLATT